MALETLITRHLEETRSCLTDLFASAASESIMQEKLVWIKKTLVQLAPPLFISRKAYGPDLQWVSIRVALLNPLTLGIWVNDLVRCECFITPSAKRRGSQEWLWIPCKNHLGVLQYYYYNITIIIFVVVSWWLPAYGL